MRGKTFGRLEATRILHFEHVCELLKVAEARFRMEKQQKNSFPHKSENRIE